MARAGDPDDRGVPSGEVAEIVNRAGELGFSRQRVASALGVSPAGLAVIEDRIAAKGDHAPARPSAYVLLALALVWFARRAGGASQRGTGSG